MALLTIGIAFMATLCKAQTKTGYANFNAIVDALPAKANMLKDMQTYQKTFEDEVQLMQNNYQAKLKVYIDTKATMTDAVRIQAEGELAGLQTAIQNYNTQAQQKLAARQQELSKPILDHVMLALQTVATEKGYAYVLDSSQQIVLVGPPADDLTAAVKLKLGVK